MPRAAPLDHVLFAVAFRDRAERGELAARLEALRRFYDELEPAQVRVTWSTEFPFALGSIRLGAGGAGDESDASSAIVTWGAPLPVELNRAEALIAASDAELRSLPDPLAAVALHGERATAVTAPGGFSALHEAQSSEVTAWSSHAVAAAWLALGRAAISSDALAELVAAEFVGDDRTLIDGAFVVPAASRISVTATGSTTSSFWPARERWRAMPPDEARERFPAVLLDTLGGRLRDAEHAVVGLTGGLDSITTAVALRELGIPYDAMTFAEGNPGDVERAAEAAKALGVRHNTVGVEWWDDATGVSRVHSAVRWFEGTAPIGFGDRPWPEPCSHSVTGIGAETGRAFYYRWVSPQHERAGIGKLTRVLGLTLQARVLGGASDSRAALADRRRGWVEEAVELVGPSWRALDVVYAEQRKRRWSRGGGERIAGTPVPAFCAPELQRVLAWLPLRDRLTDAPEREFVAARLPELAPPPPGSTPRRYPVLRRTTIAWLRSLRRKLRLPPPGPPPGPPWHTLPPWDSRPSFIEWLRDDVLASELVADALGQRWRDETRARFIAGDPTAAVVARWAGAAVALEHATRELSASPRPRS